MTSIRIVESSIISTHNALALANALVTTARPTATDAGSTILQDIWDFLARAYATLEDLAVWIMVATDHLFTWIRCQLRKRMVILYAFVAEEPSSFSKTSRGCLFLESKLVHVGPSITARCC